MNERTTDRTNQLITIFTRVLCRFILPNWRIKQISQKQSFPDSEKTPEKINLLKLTNREASTLFFFSLNWSMFSLLFFHKRAMKTGYTIKRTSQIQRDSFYREHVTSLLLFF